MNDYLLVATRDVGCCDNSRRINRRQRTRLCEDNLQIQQVNVALMNPCGNEFGLDKLSLTQK